MDSLLLQALFLPLVIALLLPKSRELSRFFALLTVLVTFAVAAILIYRYPGGTEPFAATDFSWLGGSYAGIRFSIALGWPKPLAIWIDGAIDDCGRIGQLGSY